MGFLKQASLRRSPTFRQQIYCWRSSFAIKVSTYLADYLRVFNTGNHFGSAATLTAACNIDIEYPL